MQTRARLIDLVGQLEAAQARIRQRALSDGHTLRLAALFGITTLALASTGQHHDVAAVAAAIGAWTVRDRARTLIQPEAPLPPQWLAQAIELDLSYDGRTELGDLLMQSKANVNDGLDWGRRELRRRTLSEHSDKDMAVQRHQDRSR